MTISNRVENILKASRDARNSDTELQIIYMQKSGMGLDARQIQVFRDMPPQWTIRRIRQKLQEQGKYTADPAIQRERKRRAMVTQQTAPRSSPEQLEKTLNLNSLPRGNT